MITETVVKKIQRNRQITEKREK